MIFMLEVVTKNDKYKYVYVEAKSEKKAIKKANLKDKVINVYLGDREDKSRIEKKLGKKLSKYECLLHLDKKYQKKIDKIHNLLSLLN